jgi:AmiR/NasT family two-component response regulator
MSDIEGRALILHRPHATTEAILRQLTQIGLSADCVWPDLPAAVSATHYGFMFFDADMGHDQQFPWPAGAAPMPTIALIGSEAPGRVSWAIRQGADAHLLKPIGAGGVFSALLIARETFARRQALRAEVEGLRHRLGLREALAEATALLMVAESLDAAEAYKLLRRRAMDARIPVEDMAARLVAQSFEARHHGRA